MEEHEILSALKAYVARQQGSASSPEPPVLQASTTSSLELSMLRRHTAEVWSARDGVGKLNPRNPGILNDLVQFLKRCLQRSLSWYTRSLRSFHDKVAFAIDEQATALEAVQRSIRTLESELQLVRAEVATLRLKPGLENSLPAPEPEHEVKDLVDSHLEWFRRASPILHLGSANADFLQLLDERGIAGYGVTPGGASCEGIRRKGFRVIEADLLDYLAGMPDKSLSGAYCGRVIESLPLDKQIELISLVSRKLRVDGLFVIHGRTGDATVESGKNGQRHTGKLHFLNPDVLRPILESHGFEVISMSALDTPALSIAGRAEPCPPPQDILQLKGPSDYRPQPSPDIHNFAAVAVMRVH